MDYKMIHYTVEKSIATITLDYAPTLNALDMNMSLEVESALKEAEADQAVKVVVLAGAGRAFSGGGDIRFMKAHCDEPDFAKESMGPLAGKLSEIVLYMKKMSKIVICAVAGALVGVEVNEPSAAVVAQSEACRCERSSAFAHTFIIYTVIVAVSIFRVAIHIAVHHTID